MNLQYRIDLLTKLGDYILANGQEWQEVKESAGRENPWFIRQFVDKASDAIARNFLSREKLEPWVRRYGIPSRNDHPKDVGIIMAGNIPLVGFHDFLSVFITGNRSLIRTSSRDDVLIRHLAGRMEEWESGLAALVSFTPVLKGCDAYIATGSNTSAGHFEYYFAKYPHIIRRNRTSVAILEGEETAADLENLAEDVFLYFGLGCRNVTKLYVPPAYDFVPLLDVFRKYDWLSENYRYKNNYDYNLALHILNKTFYMSTPALLLVEADSLFSPIGQLNYEYYTDPDKLTGVLLADPSLQCIVGKGRVAFGQSQYPALETYADGVDTMQFLSRL